MLIGVVVSRRIRTETDYLLAGRQLGPPLATFSIFATWFGAETCVGAAGAVYDGAVGLAPIRSATRCASSSSRPCSPAAVARGIPASATCSAGATRRGSSTGGRADDPDVDPLGGRADPGLRAGPGLEPPMACRRASASRVATGTVLVYTALAGMLADASTIWSRASCWLGLNRRDRCWSSMRLGGVGPGARELSAHWAWRAPGETTIEVLNRWAIPILGHHRAGTGRPHRRVPVPEWRSARHGWRR